MDIKVNQLVSIRHYSGNRLYRGVILEEDINTAVVKIVGNQKKSLNYSIGEPLVLGFESDDIVYVASCDIVDVDDEQNIIKIEIDSIETLVNKRVSERFPVSFNADIRIGESRVSHTSIVKNISFTGMLIYTDSEFPLYQKLKVSINIGLPVTLLAVVVRRVKDPDKFEYGLKIVYTDTDTPTIIKRYLATLKREQEEFMRKFKAEQD